MKQFLLRLENEIYIKITKTAEENGRSINQEIIQAIKLWIKKYEIENGEID